MNGYTNTFLQLTVGLYCAVHVSVGGNQDREEDRFYRRARVTEVNRPHYIGQVSGRACSIESSFRAIINTCFHSLYKPVLCSSEGSGLETCLK